MCDKLHCCYQSCNSLPVQSHQAHSTQLHIRECSLETSYVAFCFKFHTKAMQQRSRFERWDLNLTHQSEDLRHDTSAVWDLKVKTWSVLSSEHKKLFFGTLKCHLYLYKYNMWFWGGQKPLLFRSAWIDICLLHLTDVDNEIVNRFS